MFCWLACRLRRFWVYTSEACVAAVHSPWVAWELLFMVPNHVGLPCLMFLLPHRVVAKGLPGLVWSWLLDASAQVDLGDTSLFCTSFLRTAPKATSRCLRDSQKERKNTDALRIHCLIIVYTDSLVASCIYYHHVTSCIVTLKIMDAQLCQCYNGQPLTWLRHAVLSL